MNGIEICLSKQVYKPSETVYGAVFMRIICPTEIDSLSIQIECSLTYKSLSVNISKEFSQPPVEIFSWTSPLDVGFFVFPFRLPLMKDSISSIGLSSSAAAVGSYQLIVNYQASAFASRGLRRLLSCHSIFYVFSLPISPSEEKNFEKSVIFTSQGNEINVSLSLKSKDPWSIILRGGPKSTNCPEKEAENTEASREASDLFVNIALERNQHELGDPITLVSSSKATKTLQINSTSFRLVRHVELTPQLLDISKSVGSIAQTEKIRLSEVIFGSILPAVTNSMSEFQIDVIQLALPPISRSDFTASVNCPFFRCVFEIEVSVSLSPGPQDLTSEKSTDAECVSMVFKVPVQVIPPKTLFPLTAGMPGRQVEPLWLSVCLVAMAENESAPRTAQRLSFSKSLLGGRHGFDVPCQTVNIRGGKRGPAGLSPREVQGYVTSQNSPFYLYFGFILYLKKGKSLG
uniref:Arrestin C-terminal-like domain-containing protein n=1 Tax=Schistocephalus solidus TaxID=70667 RepID=A0A0V0J5J8_SCHSO